MTSRSCLSVWPTRRSSFPVLYPCTLTSYLFPPQSAGILIHPDSCQVKEVEVLLEEGPRHIGMEKYNNIGAVFKAEELLNASLHFRGAPDLGSTLSVLFSRYLPFRKFCQIPRPRSWTCIRCTRKSGN